MPDAIERLKEALADRYTIEREIGNGGMAFVYLAEEIKHGRKVALKLLHPWLRNVVEGKRFLDEIRVTASLNHPNILPLFDSGEVDGLLYYVMPYVNGETVAARMERLGPFPVKQAVEIATEVANALEFAHQNGVVHRDIKPGNILLQAGRPVISDFGIALAVARDPDQRVTGQGLMVGTPEYMSPEQAHADPSIDGRSDIYSLGTVLYEMLVGEPPFIGSSPHAILTKVIKENPIPVGARREAVPSHVDAAVMRALEKQPSDRFKSAADFAKALNVEELTSGPAEIPHEQKSVRGRRLRPIALGGTFLVLLSFAFVLALVLGNGPDALAAGQTQRFTIAPGLELDPAISPDGRIVAYSSGPLGDMKIFLKEAGVGRRGIPFTDSVSGHHRWPRWSPDGNRIVYINNSPNGSSVQILPVLDGTPSTIARIDGGLGEIYGATWSPDGTRIAYGMNGGIFLVSVAGGEPRRLVSLPDGHSPSWSPDGSRIAFVSGNPTFVFGTFVLGNIAPSALWTVSLQDGLAVQLTEATFLHMSPVWTADGQSLVFVSNHDGRRDIYQLPVSRNGRAAGERVRLTTGLNAHTVSLAKDESFLAYSVLQTNANVWSLDIPERGKTNTSTAVAVTHGNQTIEGLAVSPDGTWLAYDSDLNGTQDIYRIRIGQHAVERLTTDPHDDFYPAWTRDGHELAFYSFRSGKRDVWTMDADGSNETQVTSGSGHNRAPQWSPDGTSIVYHSDKTGRSEVYVVTRDGSSRTWSDPRQLTFDGGFYPHWSPDGLEITYIRSETVRVIPSAGGESRILTPLPDDPDVAVPWAVAWPPDGRYIYYKAFGPERRSSFWQIPAAGGPPRLLAEFDDPDFQSLRNEFGTGGDKLFFTVSDHESDIWIMNLRKIGEGMEVEEF